MCVRFNGLSEHIFQIYGDRRQLHWFKRFLKAIVELAKEYQASAIAVPKLVDIREIVQSEIKAKAEAKIPGYEDGQKKYAKQYRINIHNWSYGRLIESISTQANKLGIAIAEVKQPVRGSPTEEAKDMAISLYRTHLRSF